MSYVTIRGGAPGPPISRSYFIRSLKDVLQYCDLDDDRYNTHSFRIGAASWDAAKGMSDS